MAIDQESGKPKHVITQHNNWVSYGGGRGGLHAFTYCSWLYMSDLMEGAYAVGDWWKNPDIPDVCPHCVHQLTCGFSLDDTRAAEQETCPGCQAYRADSAKGHPARRDNAAPETEQK
ncbi:hypothetical protein OG339_48400 (plasmid) [Streptosporangium sp. NBC_01495]|uniref:hypothetical protein n=1 Tax=Streptosporangium sp. NBC_01495 TaxID=2903899 RepID=UPI002E37D89B|nr:hypothetical protein [Streptosporangium sp. NBC_01495]